MSPSKKMRQLFICLRPPHLLCFSLGWSSNIAGSVSGRIQSLKLLQNMVSKQNPISPPLYTIYVHTYSVLIHTGKGGGGGKLNQREGERGNRGQYRTQRWVENTNMTECTQELGYLQSINSCKYLPQSPYTGQFFQVRTFCIDFYESYLSTDGKFGASRPQSALKNLCCFYKDSNRRFL